MQPTIVITLVSKNDLPPSLARMLSVTLQLTSSATQGSMNVSAILQCTDIGGIELRVSPYMAVIVNHLHGSTIPSSPQPVST